MNMREVSFELTNQQEQEESGRRSFLRKLVLLTGSAGVAGLLLGRLKEGAIPQVQAATSLLIDTPNSGSGTTSLTSAGNPALTATNSSNGAALQGTCTAGTGVYGNTTTGVGVQGTASAATGLGLFGLATNPGAIPIVAQTMSSTPTANLQEWRGSSGALSAVTGDGRLGVGTPTPLAKFHVLSAAALSCNFEADGGDVNINWFKPSSTNFSTFGFFTGTPSSNTRNYYFSHFNDNTLRISRSSTGNDIVLSNSGFVGIGVTAPSHLIHLSGGAYSDGTTWTNASSIRWKENVQPLTSSLHALQQLHPVSYNYKKTPGKRTMGFIAEEVGKVLPSIVDWDSAEVGYADGYDQTAILSLAVRATQELAKQNEELVAQNEKLMARIEAIEKTIKFVAAR
jgi:hypothetical protein